MHDCQRRAFDALIAEANAGKHLGLAELARTSEAGATMSTLREKLEILEFPRCEIVVEPISQSTAVAIVRYLEDRKIRAYPIEARAPLRADSATWFAALDDYLKELGCPIQHKASLDCITGVLIWLCHHAMALEFEEAGKCYPVKLWSFFRHVHTQLMR